MFTSNFILWEMRCVTQLVKLIVLTVKELKIQNSNPDKKKTNITISILTICHLKKININLLKVKL
jgi:hypothetical protein